MSMPEEEIAIQEYIVNEVGHKGALSPEQRLFDEGIVDSFNVIELVAFLEDRFGIDVGPNDIVEANFQTLSSLGGFVRGKLGRSSKS
jgi:acyl carrier protein